MKLLFIFGLCIAGIAAATKDECLFENFKELFAKKNQEFVTKFVEWACNGKEPEMLCGMAKEMDGHGDEVLADWDSCVACPMPPCRVPFLTRIVAGSQKMTGMINRFVPAVKKQGSKKMMKNVKKTADAALALNKKSLEC